MMPTCPQCKQPIEGAQVKTYAVGWCQLDVHVGCLALHVRACRPCRTHNELLANKVPKTETAA